MLICVGNADLRSLRIDLADACLESGKMPDLRGFWGRSDSILAIHIALLWSAGIRRLPFYRHIAPLERKAESLNLNDRPMDFQH